MRPHGESEGEYSMKVVTRLTGLPADTVRAWERRYGAVVPSRTGGGTRRYSADNVRKLALLRDATRRGHRIGDIASLSEGELTELAASEGDLGASTTGRSGELGDDAFDRLAERYLEAISRFDARSGREVLARASAVLDPRVLVLEVVLPVMRRTGELWRAGELNVAHEHLVTSQVRSLLESIQRVASPRAGATRILTATPAGETHELGALAGALLAALRGFDVLHLGPSLPADDLLEAAATGRAAVVLLSVVTAGPPEETRRLAGFVAAVSHAAETWVGIARDHPAAGRLGRARAFHDFDDFDLALARLSS